VALTSVCFVLLHLLVSRIYGILYLWTGSVLPVGTVRAVFNLAPRLLNQWPAVTGLPVAYSLGLLALIVAFSWRNRTKGQSL